MLGLVGLLLSVFGQRLVLSGYMLAVEWHDLQQLGEVVEGRAGVPLVGQMVVQHMSRLHWLSTYFSRTEGPWKQGVRKEEKDN